MIRSLSRREKISYDRSPRLVCSTTYGTKLIIIAPFCGCHSTAGVTGCSADRLPQRKENHSYRSAGLDYSSEVSDVFLRLPRGLGCHGDGAVGDELGSLAALEIGLQPSAYRRHFLTLSSSILYCSASFLSSSSHSSSVTSRFSAGATASSRMFVRTAACADRAHGCPHGVHVAADHLGVVLHLHALGAAADRQSCSISWSTCSSIMQAGISTVMLAAAFSTAAFSNARSIPPCFSSRMRLLDVVLQRGERVELGDILDKLVVESRA